MLHSTDACEQAVSTATEAGAAAVADFVAGFLACDLRVLRVLQAAEHDDSLIVQTLCAALHLFSESAAGPAGARACLARARPHAAQASERERSLASAVGHWLAGDMDTCLAEHAQHQRRWPRDLAALKLGQYHHFNRGDSPGMLRLALTAQPAAQDLPALHGMLAFGWEQCHRLHEAEHSARHALALQPTEPWAQHALAHVLLTQGRLSEGASFMSAHSGTWHGLNSFMRTHNWWHLALFHLELGDTASALRLHDEQVWGVEKGCSQDQVGAVSLLARLELAGVDVGARWQALAPWLAQHASDQVLPFLDLQYLYGLARAGHPATEVLHTALRARAQRHDDDARTIWQDVAVPAAAGLVAHARGQWGRAASALGHALPRLLLIGGSHAQRDLFEQVFLDALVRDGQLAAAQNLLQPRLNASPASWRLRRQLAAVDVGLGLPPARC